MKITQAKAITVANEIQQFLEPIGMHVALGGSCLHKGGSDKDIDLIILPHNTDAQPPLQFVLAEIESKTGNKPVERDHSHYNDDKEVWKGIYNGLVIDYFFLQ